ncbi:SDR family oxidoreductase [Xenorhabdus bovienii]|uniref:SDR family NAD(P)-dependent oxidoreductase n=1 Tax=Xenorhabdus bovienii TaxID=40576 RepID=UPI0023B3210A|nr:SDR family oxidoreductase [Xenorhabdus bovienii]MDE9482408.1 SDR family oxidoreductase [Xenorhabdus bovienii]MDE9556284.1 SDR family oxidoreductase [Xenorhabdus bovienii]
MAQTTDQTRQKQAVIVSGGSRGLGLTLVTQLLEAGFCVATFSRSATEQTARLSDHPDYYWQALDSRDYNALSQFVREAEQRFGGIYGLINNSAIGSDGILALQTQDEIDRTIAVNFQAQVYLTKLASRALLRHGEGCIINISSINAVRGHSGLAVYSATKGAMDAMTRSLAREMGAKGIRVNSVSPGYFHSDMVKGLSAQTLARIKRRTPLSRLGEQQEIASLVLFLLQQGQFITGQNIVIDGGFTC